MKDAILVELDNINAYYNVKIKYAMLKNLGICKDKANN